MKLKITNKRAFRSLALKLSLCMAAFFVCQNAKAADGDEFSYEYEGQTLNYTVISETDLTCEVKSTNGTLAGNPEVWGVVIIPEKVFDSSSGTQYSVISIGNFAFSYCYLLKVTIPNSVTSIGGFAFSDCYDLTEVTIPNSVTEIRYATFSGCSSLTEVTIPNSVTSIGDYAFSSCDSLNKVNIGNSVTSIGEFAFSGCHSLNEVNIGNSVTSIGEFAFYLCESLTEVTIPNSVTEIGYGAFYGCSSLTEVTIPNSVTEIGNTAFNGCSSLINFKVEELNPSFSSKDGVLFNKSLTELIQYPEGKNNKTYTIPNSVILIGNYAFSSCSSLTEVTIPNSVTLIGNYAFSSCSSLTEVTIPNSVTEIGYAAFGNCISLSKVTIGNSLTSIRCLAFENCTSLSEVTCLNPVPPTAQILEIISEGTVINVKDIFDGCPLSEAIIYVPQQSLETYKQTSPWSEFGQIIGIESDVDYSIGIEGYDSTTLTVFNTVQLFAVITPEPEENLQVVWTSSDSEVAYVDQTGMVTAFEEGKVTITAALAAYREVSASVTFTVVSSADITQIAPEAEGCYNVFTLSGSLILSTRNADDLSRLQKGLYIINGNKVVFK